MKIKEVVGRISEFLNNSIKKSVLFRMFGKYGMKRSKFFAALSFPGTVLNGIRMNYGERIRVFMQYSYAAKIFNINTLLAALMLTAPIHPTFLRIVGVLTLVSFVLDSISRKTPLPPLREIDALIYLFSLVFYLVAGGFTPLGILALLNYGVLTTVVKTQKQWKMLCFCLIASSTLSACVGIFSDGGKSLYSEFFILIIPFAFEVSRDLLKPFKTIGYGCCTLLSLVFMSAVTKGEFSFAGLALCLYLCIRNTRYFIPATIVLTIFFGWGGGIAKTAGEYSIKFISGGILIFMSAILYINMISYTTKRPFLRNIIAAIGGSSAVFLARDGTGVTGFLFWLLLSLISIRITLSNKLFSQKALIK